MDLECNLALMVQHFQSLRQLMRIVLDRICAT
jgi:hypothetical protein